MRAIRPSRLLRGPGAAIVLGFVLSIAGTLATAFYLEPASRWRDAIDRKIAVLHVRAQLLETSQALSDATLQQGGLIYVIHAGAAPTREAVDAIGDLQIRALTSRHEGIRTYIAHLALAGVLDFATESVRYDALVAAEKAHFNAQTYMAANMFEAELGMKSVNDRAEVRSAILDLQAQRRAAASQYEDRSRIVVTMSAGGAFLIFISTLLSLQEGSPPERDRSAARMAPSYRILEGALADVGANKTPAAPEARS